MSGKIKIDTIDRAILSLVIIATGFLFLQFKAKNCGLTIDIQHLVGSVKLQTGKTVYHNKTGQDFSVTKFKYYIGRIRFISKTGKSTNPSGYYLIDEENTASKKINLDIKVAEYVSMEFIIGVDSLDNCSGAQSGSLDPVNGMFWAWNTGYIFLKLEGRSSFSPAPANLLEYHIGGYRHPDNCIRKVRLNFLKPLSSGSGLPAHITLQADVNKILEGKTVIDFSKLNAVTDHRNATSIADNYAHMFSVVE